MKYQIVVDSASDILKNEFNDDLVSVKVVPLTIHFKDKEIVDDENVDIDDFLKEMKESKGKQSTSCPNAYSFKEVFEQADYTFCITISSKLSGTYNAANLAKNELNSNNVFVIDSKAVAGVERLIVKDIIDYIKKGYDFNKICELIDTNNYNLLFVLSNFDNLIKNGRMSKFTGIFASLFSIRPLFMALDGEIKLVRKVRTINKALDELVKEMIILNENIVNGGEVVITHCNCIDKAITLKDNILKAYPNLNVEIYQARALCSFYANNDGLIVSFRGNLK